MYWVWVWVTKFWQQGRCRVGALGKDASGCLVPDTASSR